MLADLERVGGVLLQQVLDPLVVDLEVADLGAERRPLGLARLDLLEERLADPRDQPALLLRPHHRVRLARPRLPVGEHAGVVPGERVLDHVRAEVVVDALLVDEVRVGGAVRPVGVVEGELVHGHPALLAALLMLAGLEVDLVAHGGHDTVAVPLDLPGRKCHLFKFKAMKHWGGSCNTPFVEGADPHGHFDGGHDRLVLWAGGRFSNVHGHWGSLRPRVISDLRRVGKIKKSPFPVRKSFLLQAGLS